MTKCPCCCDQLLSHSRNSQVYWFCRSCWQEMPNLAQVNTSPFASVLAKIPTPVGTELWRGSSLAASTKYARLTCPIRVQVTNHRTV